MSHPLFPGLCRLVLLAALVTGSGAAAALDTEGQAFVDDMVRKHGFVPAELTALLDDAEFQESIIAAITRPAEAKPWYEYRAIMLTRERVDGGVEYWQRNYDTLRRAEAQYGVPPEVVTAIIGVETKYGRNTGRHRVLDALYTLAFGYPRRAAFFRGELEQFLVMARDEGFDARKVNGSYAGAMGKPQFMPSSFRAYAVDFDGDGRRDLWNSDADVIGSVANYFARNGWRRGERVVAGVSGFEQRHGRFVTTDLKPVERAGELTAAGLVIAGSPPADTSGNLFALQEEGGTSHWFGMSNFYAITRYNRSILYAMAVHQLSGEIAAAMQEREARGVAR
ncbi:MAG: lytic murein transglycosylase B [Gammaproteobacteria bacterium]|jgi:membrane-bound lytic murein transglycosylase B|nr:lytic murein transglycosylase B [Gammaproteobacteria bacterium]